MDDRKGAPLAELAATPDAAPAQSGLNTARKMALFPQSASRILMGSGCNVPAVIGTRSGPAVGRNTCVSPIAFGSACSYQFGASLAVFGACGRPALATPYLAYLGLTTLAYAWWISRLRRPTDFRIPTAHRALFLEWPVNARGRRAVLPHGAAGFPSDHLRGFLLELFRRPRLVGERIASGARAFPLAGRRGAGHRDGFRSERRHPVSERDRGALSVVQV